MTKFVGKSHVTTRTETGFRTLDLAFPMFSKTGEVAVGIPNSLPVLVYGSKGLGKSLICTSIAGIIAESQKKNIALRSIEGFDSEWTGAQLEAIGFTGKVHLAEGGETEEENIDKMLELMRDEKVAVGILDSIAAIQPEAEVNAKSVVEIQMGRRAQITNKMMRHVTNLAFWRESPIAFFSITHEYKSYSQYEPSTKPGGDGKQYLSRVHIKIGREKWAQDLKYILDDVSFIIKGTVEQFNYGIKGKEFWLFVLANHGLHYGMSAVFDAIQLNVAQRKRGRIVIGEWSSTLNEMLKEAHAKNDKFFQPAIDALKDIYTVQPKTKESDED
jgi:energy-coupling factor transporter ATP-binding protein EcfA2